MNKWYTLVALLSLSLFVAACSGGTDEAPADDATPTEEAAPTEAADTEANEASEEHGEEHAHGAVEATDLGTLVAALDSNNAIEVGCGSCIYGMEGVEGCELAAVVGDDTFLVTGVDFDTHGSGLCNASGHAKIAGNVHEKGISATSVELTD